MSFVHQLVQVIESVWHACMFKQKPQNGFLSITLVINLPPKLFMHEGDILVLFVDLCLRCVNFSVNCNSFLPDTTVAVLTAWVTNVSGRKRVNAKFHFCTFYGLWSPRTLSLKTGITTWRMCWTNGCTSFSNYILIFRLGIILAGH